jgi:hypothetical protein
MNEKHEHPIFLKSLFGIATIIAFGLYLFNRGTKDKNDFIKITGKIIYYSDSYLDIRRPDPCKYLQITNYQRVFEIYCDKASDGHTLPFKYNDIKLGDIVDLYFDENSFENDKRTNKEMKFIDEKGVPIFISKANDLISGLCFIGVGLIILIGLIILKKLGKIT